jgi:Holliday junction resolvase-like predicted endonuclease
MALVAETLVEEWLNRKGYFTIRGIRTGSGEIDLLAASFREPDALHVEVTVSADPIGYVGRDAGGSYVKKRTPEEVEAGAEEWFTRKFRGKGMRVARRREELCPDRDWRFMLVHGNLKYPEELDPMRERGVEAKHIGEVLEELADRKRAFVTSSEASGVAELFDIFRKDRGS